MKKVEYRDIRFMGSNNPSIDASHILSAAEALEDIDEFEYILKNGYILYEEFNKKHKIAKKIQEVRKSVGNMLEISVHDLGKMLHSCIEDIVDLHAGINYGEWHPLGGHFFFFYSNVIIKKVGKKYYYVSGLDELSENALFTDSPEKIFKIVSNDDSLYCVGLLSDYYEETMTVKFDGQEYVVPLMRNTDIYEDLDINMDKYSCAYFDADGMSNLLAFDNKEFMARYGNHSKILFDFRGHRGGFPDYVKLVSIVYDFENSYKEYIDSIKGKWECKQLVSPVTAAGMISLMNTLQSSDISKINFERKRWERIRDEQKKNPSSYYEYRNVKKFTPHKGQNAYAGEIILLINCDSISAGEAICGFFYEDFGSSKYTVIGENSGGVYTTGDCIGAYLSYSNIFLGIPTTLIRENASDINFKGEGHGFYPDYWLRNNNDLILFLER